MGSFAFGRATRYERVQLLKASFGQGADIPAFYYMGLSTTAPDDTGAITEVAVDTYARVKIAAWKSMLGSGPGSGWSIETVVPAAGIRFPNPTITWFPTATPVYPFLADQLTGGNVRWFWRDGLGLPGLSSPRPGHPLIFPALDPSSPESGTANVFIGLATRDPALQVSGAFAYDLGFLVPRALKALTKLISPPSAPLIYAGVGGTDTLGFAHPEPGPGPLWGIPAGDPNYVRLLLNWSTAALDGSGNAFVQNTNAPFWTVTAGHEANWNTVKATDNMRLWDTAGIANNVFPQGNALCDLGDVFFGGPAFGGGGYAAGDTLTIQAGSVKVTLN